MILLGVVANVQPKTCWVDATMAPDQKGTEDRLCEEVKNAVESGLRVWGNKVPTLTEAPGNRIEDPEESRQGTAHEEGSTNILTQSTGGSARIPDKRPDDEAKRDTAEAVVTPLIGAFDERANETSHDHDLIDENHVEHSRPRQSCGEQKVHEEQWGCDEPVFHQRNESCGSH